MGRISDAVESGAFEDGVWRNKVDDILDELDDDGDRAIVLSWLHDPATSDQVIEDRLFEFDIECSDSTVREWRKRNKAGRWAA